jgi:hypothetical protein
MGGNSTVTFLNTKTGNRFTYRIKVTKTPKESQLYFVKLLTSPDTYQFIGSIFVNKFKHSQRSNISAEAQGVRVFQYVFNKLSQGKLEDFIEIYHEGKCGRCGRQLTVPESITSGFGPECIKMMHTKQTIRQLKIDKILE